MNLPITKASNIVKKLRPRKRHLRYVWVGLIVLAGLSFLAGQVLLYVSQAIQ